MTQLPYYSIIHIPPLTLFRDRIIFVTIFLSVSGGAGVFPEHVLRGLWRSMDNKVGLVLPLDRTLLKQPI